MRKRSSRSRTLRPRGRPSTARAQLAVLQHLHQAAAAWALGVTDKTLRDAIAAPRNVDGRYNAQLLVAWWIERQKRKAGGSLSENLERIRRAKADAAERRNAIEAGKLISIEEVQSEARSLTQQLAAELESVGRAAGPEMKRLLDEALARFSGDLKRVGQKVLA